jgi:hypothetical protein
MEQPEIFSDELEAAFKNGVAEAILESRKAGLPVFYHDYQAGIDVMEQPDGRKFEIRYIPNAPGDQNHQVVRELIRTAA